MGVTYSSDDEDDIRHKIRMTQFGAETLVHIAFTHHFPLFIDNRGLRSLLLAVMETSQDGLFVHGAKTVDEYIALLWEVFAEDDVIQTKEFIAIIILLCDASVIFLFLCH